MLEMLEVKKDRWFGRLDDDSSKIKWMRCVYPRVDYTHQAPWTVVMLRQPSQSTHTSKEAWTVRWRFGIPYVVSCAPLVGDSAEVVSSSATSSTEFDST